MNKRARVLLMSTDNYKDMNEQPPYYLKDSNLRMWAHFADPEFDNNDSRYIKIRMHVNSNYESDYPDRYLEKQIGMVECENEFIDEALVALWYTGKLYCPDYSEEDFMQSNYNYKKHSWMRLVVHRCDPEERALEGKDCAPIEEINEYVHSYVFSLSYQKMTPTIDSDSIYIKDTFQKYYVDADYSTPINNLTAVGKEFSIYQSKIILDDQLLGIFDNPEYIDIVDVEQSLNYIRPNT